MVTIEAEIDQHWDKKAAEAPTEPFQRLLSQVRLLSYIESMEKDVQRMRVRFNPGPSRRGEDGPAH